MLDTVDRSYVIKPEVEDRLAPHQVNKLCSDQTNDIIDRAKLEDLLKQRFFYDMSFSIYGGK